MHSNSKRKNGREVLQKGKSGKRPKEWHRGTVELAKWDRATALVDQAFDGIRVDLHS